LASSRAVTVSVVADALASKISSLPEQLRGSLTWDHGKEMAQLFAGTTEEVGTDRGHGD